MNIDDVRRILRNTPEAYRKTIENMITGDVEKQVICNDCGRHIADIYSDGKIEPVVDAKGIMWLFAYRPRLDGYFGFQCACGNDSRLCTQEKGVRGIEKNHVTPNEVKLVLGRVKKAPVVYEEKDGVQVVDNFIIKRL